MAPASAAASRPSANGKKASEATTEPLARGSVSPAALAASCDFQAAMRVLSTRLICPAPMPTVAPSLAYTTAFELTCLAILKANFRSPSSCAVGCRLVTTLSSRSSTTALSRDCTRKPPESERKVSPGARGSGKPPVVSSRKFFFCAKIALASGVASGAITTSVKMPVISRAVAASIGPLSAMMPPKALTGSQRNALA